MGEMKHHSTISIPRSILFFLYVIFYGCYYVDAVKISEQSNVHSSNIFHRSVQFNTTTQTCYDNILSAAASPNNVTDGVMSQSDFIVFCNILSDNYFAGITNFTSLPLQLVLLYNNLAIASCFNYYCTGNLEINVQPLVNASLYNQSMSQVEASYYSYMCVSVNQTIAKLRTSAPSLKPPSNRPSARPSRRTKAPTRKPSMKPSKRPTIRPSSRPSARPSRYPSFKPSVKVSKLPTISPVPKPFGPTRKPTTMPSKAPSIRHSLKPIASIKPTVRPSNFSNHNPTRKPSIHASNLPLNRPTSGPASFATRRPSLKPAIYSTTRPTRTPSSRPSTVSKRPTRGPTRKLTIFPSLSTRPPIRSPSSKPFQSVSTAPSNRPTVLLSQLPTRKLSKTPSNTTMTPSRQPTFSPFNRTSRIPTVYSPQSQSPQTVRPSKQGSVRPIKPTAHPSETKSRKPTIRPTSALPLDVYVPFILANNAGYTTASLLNNIQVIGGIDFAFSELVQAQIQFDNSLINSRKLRKRSLDILFTGSSISNIQDIGCPSSIPPGNLCQQATGWAYLVTVNEDISKANETISKQLTASIANGDLTILLKQNNVTSSFSAYPYEAFSPKETLGSGAIAGIVVGSAFVALMGVAFFALNRRRSVSKMTDDSVEVIDVSQSLIGDLSAKDGIHNVANTHESSNAGAPDLMAQIAVETDREPFSSPGRSTDSSVVSSTGWSSSAGLHSFTSNDLGITIDTSDHDSQIDESETDVPTPQLLEDLIRSGDWAGVIQTAARLDPISIIDDGLSQTSLTKDDKSISTTSDVDDDRIFVKTADVASGAVVVGSGRAKTLEEMRVEIESLVRRVFPSETENIGEMMYQFQGREEELIETLRRMQERQIAKKARMTSHMDAKLKASSSSRYSWKESFGSHQDDMFRVRQESLILDSLGHEDVAENASSTIVDDTIEKPMDPVISDTDISIDNFHDDQDNFLTQESDTSDDLGNKYHSMDVFESLDSGQIIEKDNIHDGTLINKTSHYNSGEDEEDRGDLIQPNDEHDALIQAQLWLDIAAQTKGDVSKGALDAADWAIARSLSALNAGSNSASSEDDLCLKEKSSECGSDSHSVDSSNDKSL